MYTLYYMPGACSLATNTVLRELKQDFNLIDKNKVSDFKSINPIGAIPVLKDGDMVIREGVAILLHLLSKHENNLLPSSGKGYLEGLQNMLFANATMHPAYGRLFFIAGNIDDGNAKAAAFSAAADAINGLWSVVESQLQDKPFLGGNSYSVADILLTVYASWGQYFPVDINIGERAQKMIDAVSELETFKQASAEEKKISEAA